MERSARNRINTGRSCASFLHPLKLRITEQLENDKKKGGARVRFPPAILPIITIVSGHYLSSFLPLVSGFDLPTPARYWIGGLIAAGALLVLGLWPVILFHRAGQSELPWTPTTEIIIRGPYQFTRNPMYLMMVLFCIGFAIILSDVWTAILTPVCAALLYLIAIRPEEAYLEGKFGESYRAYTQKVRRWV
jgi:protein-S-isoprenylcysteine O-methyltransferase Ste14